MYVLTLSLAALLVGQVRSQQTNIIYVVEACSKHPLPRLIYAGTNGAEVITAASVAQNVPMMPRKSDYLKGTISCDYHLMIREPSI